MDPLCVTAVPASAFKNVTSPQSELELLWELEEVSTEIVMILYKRKTLERTLCLPETAMGMRTIFSQELG